jgi:ADP-ribose pyrophosphatase
VETIAGMIEPGETPEEVALREAVEEANCAVDQLIPIAEYYCSPGGCSEKVYLYCARTCVSQMVNGSVHGLQHEAEDIRLHLVAFDELVENYRAGHYQTAMTLIAVQWLLLHRDHVRNVWLG